MLLYNIFLENLLMMVKCELVFQNSIYYDNILCTKYSTTTTTKRETTTKLLLLLNDYYY